MTVQPDKSREGLRVFGTVVVTIVGLFGALLLAGWFNFVCQYSAMVNVDPPSLCELSPHVVVPIVVLAVTGADHLGDLARQATGGRRLALVGAEAGRYRGH